MESENRLDAPRKSRAEYHRMRRAALPPETRKRERERNAERIVEARGGYKNFSREYEKSLRDLPEPGRTAAILLLEAPEPMPLHGALSPLPIDKCEFAGMSIKGRGSFSYGDYEKAARRPGQFRSLSLTWNARRRRVETLRAYWDRLIAEATKNDGKYHEAVERVENRRRYDAVRQARYRQANLDKVRERERR